MKVTINGKTYEYETIDDLEDAIEYELDNARVSGYDEGIESGYDDGYEYAKQELRLSHGAPEDRRTEQLRLDLYRAIYAEDMEKAEDMINLMAMVDIDRDLIWQAKREIRKNV